MVFGAMDAQDGLAAPHWLLITFVVYTWGELCLSPVGLSMVTKLAPVHLQSVDDGALVLLLLALQPAGRVGGPLLRSGWNRGEATFLIEGLPGFYLLLVVAPIATGFLIWFLSPTLAPVDARRSIDLRQNARTNNHGIRAQDRSVGRRFRRRDHRHGAGWCDGCPVSGPRRADGGGH